MTAEERSSGAPQEALRQDPGPRPTAPAAAAVIRVFDDYERLSLAAADFLVDCAQSAVNARGRFVVALSGGETPQRMLELLAAAPLRDAVPWPYLHVFWGDERCVPLEDPRSNAGRARRILLDRVALADRQIHAMDCRRSPAEAAADCEAQIHRLFGGAPPCFDLIFLGLGSDGHTASLFPGSGLLAERHRWVGAVPTEGANVDRVSFTPVLINQAAVVALLVSGDTKADAVLAVQKEPRDPLHLPAQAIRPTDGRLIWLLDRAAAARLDAA